MYCRETNGSSVPRIASAERTRDDRKRLVCRLIRERRRERRARERAVIECDVDVVPALELTRDVTERPADWTVVPAIEVSAIGSHRIRMPEAQPGHRYAVRSRASLPLFSVNGAELTIVVPAAAERDAP